MKIFLLLCILPFALLDIPYGVHRWNECLKNYENQNLTLAYFSQHYTGYKTLDAEVGNYTAFVVARSASERIITRYEDKFLLLCYCESNLNQPFFLSPYIYTNYPPIGEYYRNEILYYTEPGTFHTAIVLCMNDTNSYQDFGIYDEYELFDSLLFERIISVPNSVIDPFGNEKLSDNRLNENNETLCYDLFGFQTKDILGQRTCLLAVEMSSTTNYQYSGPLLGNSMITFPGPAAAAADRVNDNNFDIEDFCFATKNTTTFLNEKGYCYYQNNLTKSIFQCCSTPTSQSNLYKDVIDAKKYFCFPGNFEDFNLNIQKITMKNYIKNYVNYACSVTIRPVLVEKTYKYNVTFGSESNCTNESIITVQDDKFCSADYYFPKKITVKKCCINGHFCNQRLLPEYVPRLESQCKFPIPRAIFLNGKARCQSFYDKRLSNRVKIVMDLNAIKPKQKSHIIGGEHHFVYLQIIKADSKGCKTRFYNETEIYQYRPFCNRICNTDKCDFVCEASRSFLCENLAKTEFKNDATSYPTSNSKTYGWICYVQIKNDVKNKSTVSIQAGELKNIRDHDRCLRKDIMHSDGTFCCSHVFDVKQSDTICTVEKLIKKYKEANPNIINNGTHGYENQYFTDCFIRDLPSDLCLAEAGCFETRMLEYSKNSDAIEPAGCVDNTEKYIADNLPLASVSLGCRVGENSNRCSVVQTPDGQQRILCCCNGKECENNFKNLPNQLGKKISSFKNVNI